MSKIRESTLSNCEKNFLLKSLLDDTRLDGRAFDECRKLCIEFGKDWGSCYVSLGKTKVLAQVSCEIQEPKSTRPSEGILNINVELNPLSAPHFEAGRQSELSVQLNRILEKCLKDSKTVDLESLCVKVSEKVWALRIDVNVLNHEGNLLDCASIAALSAISHFRRPDVTSDGEDFVIHSYKQRDPIPTVLHHYPVCVSYAIFENGKIVLADPSILEENVAEAHLTVGINSYRELCALHLGGKAEVDSMLILQITKKAADRAAIVVQTMKDTLEQDKINREKISSVGFQNAMIFDKDTETSRETLIDCLDPWEVKASKRSKEPEKVINPANVGRIESLGTGSAILLTTETEPKAAEWEASSNEESEEEEVKIVEQKSKTEEVVVLSDDSEEEKVVVLNADQQTNKKKKR